jgi:hypothetical protein
MKVSTRCWLPNTAATSVSDLSGAKTSFTNVASGNSYSRAGAAVLIVRWQPSLSNPRRASEMHCATISVDADPASAVATTTTTTTTLHAPRNAAEIVKDATDSSSRHVSMVACRMMAMMLVGSSARRLVVG